MFTVNPEIFRRILFSRKALKDIFTLVNVYVDLLVFMRIAGTSETGCGRYLC